MNFPHFRRFDERLSLADALASMLLERSGENPLELAGTLVLLPSRRACRTLREAFLRQSEGRPQLLPRIMPIGEVENEADILALCESPENLLPAMPEKRRLAMLSRLVMQGEQTTPARAYQLAVELARLHDEVIRHNLTFANLGELVPLELAAHWQKTTEFLGFITRQWPRILEAEQRADQETLTRENMRALAHIWRKTPPDFPIIAAGSTGSIPATAELLISIAHMPKGMVILPGLDADMPDDAWSLLDPTHPHYGLKLLLEKAGVEKNHVDLLTPSQHGNDSLRALFTPAALTAHWRETTLHLEQDFAHLSLMEAPTQLEEARMIAYQLRAALESPGKTAALVTPDRILARIVASECARYGIVIDDSGGEALPDTPAAIFLRLILDVVETGASPVALLALLRHPFAALGNNTAHCRELSRLLELKLLRGVRLETGLDALAETAQTNALPHEIINFVHRLRDRLRPLEMLFVQQQPCNLAELGKLHIAAAEALATTEETAGADILWAKESGNALAEMLTEWIAHGEALGQLAPSDYPALFDALISSGAVRKPYGAHPRLHILSPIEARLTHYDTVILGEMNEGTWPATIPIDPWMSAEMREAFGLPSHALSIGQSAHDVWMLLHAPRVILTRARKIAGSPQKPSRWWVRLTTLVTGKDKDLLARMDISAIMQATIRAQDAPYTMKPLARPEATPPISARPRHFSPSSIELWCDEPYAFYAKKILGLDPLASLDQDADAVEFGKSIHAALEHFSAEHPDQLPPHAYQLLLAHGERILQPYMNQPAVSALWWPRFEAIARNWLARETQLRAQTYHTTSEVSAAWTFEVADTEVTLRARADRIDRMQDGFRLIDYKTGTPPSAKKVKEGEAKQLPLTALALIRSGTVDANPTSLIYWALKTREKSKDYVEIEDATELLAVTEEELKRMIAESYREEMAYVPRTVSQLSDFRDEYDHLIRRKEWGAG